MLWDLLNPKKADQAIRKTSRIELNQAGLKETCALQTVRFKMYAYV